MVAGEPHREEWWKFILMSLYVVGVSLPVSVFFANRGGLDFLAGADARTLAALLFPLLGLLAFGFLAMQVLIGSNGWWLKRLWPGVYRFHRAHALFVLLFAVLHPLFVMVGYGLADYLAFEYVASHDKRFVLMGYAALTIIILTIVTAWLGWNGRLAGTWKPIHYLNYAAFGLVWIHSWNLGSDLDSSQLRLLWSGYLVLVLASLTVKHTLGRNPVLEKTADG